MEAFPSELSPPPVLTAGTLISRTFRMLFRHMPALLGVTLVCYLPTFIALATVDRESEDSLAMTFLFVIAASLALAHVATGVLSYYVFMQLSGRKVAVMHAVSTGLRRIFPVLAVGILLSIITALGYRMLYVPGAILNCMLFVAIPVTVVERTGVFRSLSRSKDLTAGSKGSIFGAFFVLSLAMMAAAFVIGLVISAFAGDDSGLAYIYGYWAFTVLSGAATAVAASVAYHDLRQFKEGTQIEELTAVFE
jgi:hypothetical protein